jgi:hypothetical protein
MNGSLRTAGFTEQFKILAVSSTAAAAVVAVGLCSRAPESTAEAIQYPSVKAERVVVASQEGVSTH